MRSSLENSLVLALSCWAAFRLDAADTNPPVVLSAASFDGQTVGVCFSEVLDPTSATNVGNYRIADTYASFRLASTNFSVVEAVLRADQRSVLLRLAKQFPGVSFNLYTTNISDPDRNSGQTGATTRANNLTAADIGNVGVDPRETGTFFNCELGSFEVVAGGSGLESTNDSFHFIYERSLGPGLTLLARVTALEAANRFSSAGLMAREDLSPGSRFFAVMVTPPDVPASDGSGNGANRIRVLYREQTAGAVTEVAVTNFTVPFPDVWLELDRLGQRFLARFSTNRVESFIVGDFTFTSPFSEQLLAGMATTSQNNNPGFTTKATYSNTGLLKGDVFQGPRLFAESLTTNLLLKWSEPLEFPYFLLCASEPNPAIIWEPVTNQVTYQITSSNVQAAVTVPISDSPRFFGLRMSRW